ncbi:hypothetical protein C1H46_000422 [Malus baccata]|uniref:Uncharacterized protein n=1 Tax=Malus baccata TaxID=106549 RepID=A0A540NTW3_MALBA|nr:hypothetical protein C1H46_000422 [Malus baccata]
MSEEMKSVWDRPEDIEHSSKPKNPDYSEREVSLPLFKELVDEPTNEETPALKMQSYKRLTDSYDHLDGFIYAVEGWRNNDATKCKLLSTTLIAAVRDWFK